MKALEMRVVGLSRTPQRFHHIEHSFDHIASLKTELNATMGQADFVVVAVPHTTDTRGMISREVLQSMKQTATLINFTRPAVVDEEAMLEYLRRRLIAAAYVSRLEARSKLFRFRHARLPNLVITHNSEAHYRQKLMLYLGQFIRLLDIVRATGRVPNRVA